MEISDHPLPTPPSIPPDVYERLPPSPKQQQVQFPTQNVEAQDQQGLSHRQDPLSASPDLSHPAVVDAFTSDVRDEPPAPTPLSPVQPLPSETASTKVDIPEADATSLIFDRPSSEPAMAMDVDEEPESASAHPEMVNGHKDAGEYTAQDFFSGPAVESPPPTQPTPPPADIANPPSITTAPTHSPAVPPPPSMVSAVEQAPDVLPTSTTPLPHHQSLDIEMKEPPQWSAPTTSKPVHYAPTSDEPPAKRLKTEPTETSSQDSSKKLPTNQQRFLLALLRQVKKSKDSIPFREPVDPVKLNIPLYFSVVDRPMDLSTIEKKLTAGEYQNVDAVLDDFKLMIENCVKFNGPDNVVTKMGKNIEALWERSLKTLPAEAPPPPPKPAPPPVIATPPAAPKPKPALVRKTPGVPAIRRESLTADGRPKREIKPPPERDIPMDKPRLRKKNAAQLRFCQSVMKELQKKVHEPYSYPFIAPVDAVALQIPDYYKIIKNPMDLGTIETKLKEQQYTSADEFYADVKLIFKNCYKYNGVDSPVSGLAKQLEKVFDKKWAEKPEDPPEKPAKQRPSSSPVREEEEEEESSSDEDEIDRIQEQMTQMAKRLSEMKQRKKQKHEKIPSTSKGKGSKGGTTTKKRSSIGGATAGVEKAPSKPKKPKEVIPEVTFEQKRELSEKINFLSPSKMQGVLELIKDAMPLDAVLSLYYSILTALGTRGNRVGYRRPSTQDLTCSLYVRC